MNKNYNYLLMRFNGISMKLSKFQERLVKSQKKGSFDKFTSSKKKSLIRRIEKLQRQYSSLLSILKKASFAGAIAASFLVANPASAQLNLTEKTLADNPFSAINMDSIEVKPYLVDIDGDLDLDLFVGDGDGNLSYYENTGSATAPAYELQSESNNPLPSSFDYYYINVSFADIDDDGDYDALVSESYGDGDYYTYVTHYQNTGTAQAPVFTEYTETDAILVNETFNYGYGQANFADVDSDGDYDVVFGEGDADGGIRFFENTGTKAAWNITENTVSNPFSGIDVGDEPKTTFANIDGDADIDLIIGNGDGQIYFYENTTDGSGAPVYVLNTVDNSIAGDSIGSYVAPNAGDVNGDGIVDLIVGTDAGIIRYFENAGTVTGNISSSEDINLTVFPNPIMEQLNLESSENIVSYEILSVEGELMLNNTTDDKSISIDVNELSTGTYVLKITTSTGVVYSETISKVK